MELARHVTAVQDQIRAAASLGDERAAAVAEALAVAAAPAVRLALLAAVAAAADEVSAALSDAPGAPLVGVRLDGDEIRIDVVASEARAEVPAAEDADTNARVSLRLSESLKTEIDEAARQDGLSVNSWLLRAAQTALAGRRGAWPGGRFGGASRVTGWVSG